MTHANGRLRVLRHDGFVGLILLVTCVSCSDPEGAFRQAEASDTPEAYRQFIDRFPDSEHVSFAERRLAELNMWQRALDIRTAAAFKTFRDSFPDSEYSDEALARLAVALFADTLSSDAFPPIQLCSPDAVNGIDSILGAIEQMKPHGILSFRDVEPSGPTAPRSSGESYYSDDAMFMGTGFASINDLERDRVRDLDSRFTLRRTAPGRYRISAEHPGESILLVPDGMFRKAVATTGYGTIMRAYGQISGYLDKVFISGTGQTGIVVAMVEGLGLVYLCGSGSIEHVDHGTFQFPMSLSQLDSIGNVLTP